jgi:translation initiation factor IF-1
MELSCLFENAHYIVCQISGSGALHSEGIEVVSKDNQMTAYLTGRMRKTFMRQVKAWREKTPEETEVEARLEEFLVLNANPLVLH